MTRASIIGIGAKMPAKCVHNRELDPKLETSHEWIMERTGIEQRYIADDNEFTSTLAAGDRKSTRLNSSHERRSRMPSSA